MPAAKNKNMPRPQTSLRLDPEARVLFGILMKYLRNTHSATNFNAAVMWVVRRALDELGIMPSAKALKAAVTRLIRKEKKA